MLNPVALTAAKPKPLGRRPTLLQALVVLDAFAVGGLFALFLVQRLLETIMDRLATATAQAELLNVLDHLLPYWAGYSGITGLLVIATLAVYRWSRNK